MHVISCITITRVFELTAYQCVYAYCHNSRTWYDLQLIMADVENNFKICNLRKKKIFNSCLNSIWNMFPSFTWEILFALLSSIRVDVCTTTCQCAYAYCHNNITGYGLQKIIADFRKECKNL